MAKIFTNFLIILGSVLIGFGMGMITVDSLALTGIGYWIIVAASLISGGFLIAVGLTKKEKKIEENSEE